jgi:tetratricopeptide (TPR) repeat protein
MRILRDIRAVLDNYHIKSGIYHFYRGEYKQAIDFLGRGLSDPKHLAEPDAGIARFYLTQSHLYAAEAAGAEGAFAREIEELGAAAAVNPRYPDIQYRLGRALERAGRLPQAIEKYRRACEINPRYIEARTGLGFALIESGRSEEAAEEFQEVFKITVARIARPFREGLRCLTMKQPETAAQQFRDAFFAEPHRQSKLYQSALSHLREENWEAAAADLKESLSLSPGYADLHNYLGVALAESGHRANAIASFRESVHLNPHYTIAWLNLAYTLTGPGDAREAEEILERLLVAEPENSAARARLEELRGSRLDPRRLEARRSGRGHAR